MKQEKKAKILEIMLDGTVELNVHIYFNEGINIYRITSKKNKEDLNPLFQNNMLNQNGRFSLDYETYKATLEKSIKRLIPNSEVIIREKQISPEMERLYEKFLNKKYK